MSRWVWKKLCSQNFSQLLNRKFCENNFYQKKLEQIFSQTDVMQTVTRSTTTVEV